MSNVSGETPTAGIPVGQLPSSVAVTPDGSHAYVTNAQSGSVSVIDLAMRTVSATIDMPPVQITGKSFSSPSAVAINPTGRHAYVVGLIDGGIRRIETATNTLDPCKIEGHIGIGFPGGFAISSDGRLGYAADQSMGGLRVINLANNTATEKWIMLNDSAPRAVAITPDGRSLYTTTFGCSVVVVDTGSGNVVGHDIIIGCDPAGVDVTRDGRRLLVVNATEIIDDTVSTISVINTATNKVFGS
ncbi:MAG: YncE family protein [Pseudonocardiaceae bacterium]